MTNEVVLNAEFYLHLNLDNNEIWSNYERHYNRLHFNANFPAKRPGQVKSNRQQATIISNLTKIYNYKYLTLLLNIFFKYYLNFFI